MLIDYFIKPLNWWLLPSTVFTTTFLLISNIYAVLDFLQPEWYKSRCVYDKQNQYKPLTLKVWVYVVCNNIKNMFDR